MVLRRVHYIVMNFFHFSLSTFCPPPLSTLFPPLLPHFHSLPPPPLPPISVPSPFFSPSSPPLSSLSLRLLYFFLPPPPLFLPLASLSLPLSLPLPPLYLRVVYEGPKCEYVAEGFVVEEDILYYFRVAAVNDVGIGPYSTSTAYTQRKACEYILSPNIHCTCTTNMYIHLYMCGCTCTLCIF